MTCTCSHPLAEHREDTSWLPGAWTVAVTVPFGVTTTPAPSHRGVRLDPCGHDDCGCGFYEEMPDPWWFRL